MLNMARRLATVGAATLMPVAFATIVTPGVSTAVECGWGTVFDPPSNTCVAAPAPPPPVAPRVNPDSMSGPLPRTDPSGGQGAPAPLP